MNRLELDRRLVQIRPDKRQIDHQSLEFYGFIHFTVNTFTDKEWGDGTEPESIFNPTALDARQWARTAKAAGMRGLILTCKHHDGFCLWPSKYTSYTVANSPFRNGKGDVVRETASACREYGLKFGVYLSPWDRNHKTYGYGVAYDDYFVNQLTELLTGYGEIFSVWLDGACGEGSNGKCQKYDWNRYYEVIRKLQPNACISVCGPDVRWCGNEAGDTRPSEWSVVPLRTRNTEIIAEKSQQADESQFRKRKIHAEDRDLGSRQALEGEEDLIWYPAEVNTSIRPGWFYHESEDNKVRSLKELIQIYNRAVGGNATFLLNIPPTREGLFHETDKKRLEEFGTYIRAAYAANLLETAKLSCDSFIEGFSIEAVRNDNYDSYFCTEDGVTACTIEAKWKEPQQIGIIVLKENISLSQRIESFAVDVFDGEKYREVYCGTVVGYKKIVSLSGVQTSAVKIRILDARVAPTLSFIGIYQSVRDWQ